MKGTKGNGTFSAPGDVCKILIQSKDELRGNGARSAPGKAYGWNTKEVLRKTKQTVHAARRTVIAKY